MTKRIGRFEFDGTFESGGFPRRIDILMDHANGDARVYEFPNVEIQDAEDLVYGLSQLLRHAVPEPKR